jgi:hypothetical protein
MTVVDSSAVIVILCQEADADTYLDAIDAAGHCGYRRLTIWMRRSSSTVPVIRSVTMLRPVHRGGRHLGGACDAIPGAYRPGRLP